MRLFIKGDFEKDITFEKGNYVWRHSNTGIIADVPDWDVERIMKGYNAYKLPPIYNKAKALAKKKAEADKKAEAKKKAEAEATGGQE